MIFVVIGLGFLYMGIQGFQTSILGSVSAILAGLICIFLGWWVSPNWFAINFWKNQRREYKQ